MAERRMFTMKVIDSDAFLEMPLSTQSLYFHLNMRADDDGFINNPKKISRMIGASEDDLKLLIVKRFVIGFETGVIVIKHWRMHNLLRKDRYQPTQYQEEFNQLHLKDNGSYTDWQPNGNQVATICQPSIVKDSIVEDSKEKSIEKKRERFTPPTLEEVKAYCEERKNGIDAQHFLDYYEQRKWFLSKGVKMADWKAAVRTWEHNHFESDKKTKPKKETGFDLDDFFEAATKA